MPQSEQAYAFGVADKWIFVGLGDTYGNECKLRGAATRFC